MKPYIENESLNSVLRKLDNKYISISDLKGNYTLLNNLAKTKIVTKRSITSEEYWKMELMVSSLTTEFKSVFFELNINFNKAGYDGLVNNGRPLNILRRIISILGRHISREAVKDLENIKKNLDTKKVLSSRQLKEKVREIIKREDLIIQPRLNSISVCKNNNGGGTGMSMSQGSSSRIKWGEEVVTNQTGLQQKSVNTENPDFHQKFDPRPAEKEFSINNDDQLSLWEELYEGVSYREFKEDSFHAVKISFKELVEGNLSLETHTNKWTKVETIMENCEDDNLIAVFSGTYFAGSIDAIGQIVNYGKDITLYNQLKNNLGSKIEFVKQRGIFYYTSKETGIGQDNFKGKLLSKYPDMIWGIGGTTAIRIDGKDISMDYLTSGRDKDKSDFGKGPGFVHMYKDGRGGQLRSAMHLFIGSDDNNNIYFLMNSKSMIPVENSDIYCFFNKLGLKNVVKGDGGSSAQFILYNGVHDESPNYGGINNQIYLKSNK